MTVLQNKQRMMLQCMYRVPRHPSSAHLDETDVLGQLAEALPVDVKPVLPDEAPVAARHTAAAVHTTRVSATDGKVALLLPTAVKHSNTHGCRRPAGAEGKPLYAARGCPALAKQHVLQTSLSDANTCALQTSEDGL